MMWGKREIGGSTRSSGAARIKKLLCGRDRSFVTQFGVLQKSTMPSLSKSTVVLHQSLNPDTWEGLVGKLSSIPGFDQLLPEREIVHIYLPARILLILGKSKLIEIFEANRSSFRWHSNRNLIFHFGVPGRLVSLHLLDDLCRAIDGFGNLTVELSQVLFGKPPGADTLLRFDIGLSFASESMMYANVRTGYLEGRNPPRDSRKVDAHEALLGETLRSAYSRLGLPVADVTNEGAFSKSESSSTNTILDSWRHFKSAEWLSSMADEPVRVSISLVLPESQVEIEELLFRLKGSVRVFEMLPWSFDGGIHLKWRGFPQMERRWLELGAFVIEMDPCHGPIEFPLGFIRTGSGSMDRVPLNLYRVDKGALLVAKGGGAKMAKMLSEHFEIPWRSGASPIAFSGRLEGVAPPEFPEARPPVEFYKVPGFFKNVESESSSIERQLFLKHLETAEYFERYPPGTIAGATKDLIDGSQVAQPNIRQLALSLVRWEEPEEWEEALDGILQQLHEASYGLFTPKNIQVAFEDDEGSPEPGSEVRISFDFGGKRHEVVGEFFHGSVPYELMPFVQKLMEEHCNGVAFRPIFGEGPEFALCTSGALERLKKAFGVLG